MLPARVSSICRQNPFGGLILYLSVYCSSSNSTPHAIVHDGANLVFEIRIPAIAFVAKAKLSFSYRHLLPSNPLSPYG